MAKLNKKIQQHLLNIDNVFFYLDFNALGKFVKLTQKQGLTEGQDEHDFVIDISKYEMIKMMIDIVMTYGGDSSVEHQDMDKIEKIINKASDFDNMPLAFKIAFNTLLVYKILVKYEPAN